MCKMKTIIQGLMLLLLGGVLTACQSLPLGVMSKLGNPLELDPAEIKFAVRGPSLLRLQQDNLRLRVTYEHPELAKPLERTYAFVQAPENAIPAVIQSDLQAGERVDVFVFDAATVAALRELQQELKAYTQGGKAGKGSVNLSLDNACKTGALPEGALYVGIYAQLQQTNGFFEIAPRFDLRRLVEQAQKGNDWQGFPDCQLS